MADDSAWSGSGITARETAQKGSCQNVFMDRRQRGLLAFRRRNRISVQWPFIIMTPLISAPKVGETTGLSGGFEVSEPTISSTNPLPSTR